MYESLRLLGQLKSSGDPFARITKQMPERYVLGLAVRFRDDGSYAGLSQKRNDGSFAFKEAAPRANTLPLPITMVSGRPHNTVNRLKNTLEQFGKNTELGEFAEFCRQAFTSWSGQEERVNEEIMEALSAMQRDNESIFLYASHDDPGLTPLTENESLKRFFTEGYVQDNFGSCGRTACHKDKGVCSVCGLDKVAVYGNFSLIACYNLDKESVIAGGFSPERAADNFPVCADCILDIGDGFKYAQNELTSYLSGFQYMALPKALTGDEELNRQIIDELISHYKERQKAGKLRRIAGVEKELLEMLDREDIQDNVSLLLVLFATSKAQWSILLEIEELLPSRIRTIREAIEASEETIAKYFYTDSWQYTFGHLRDAFKVKYAGTSQLDQKIVQYLEAVFSDHPVAESDMLAGGVTSILGAQREGLRGKQDHSYFVIRNTLATWLFLNYLQLFHQKGKGDAMDYLDQFTGPYVDMLRELSAFFDQPDKAAAFLIGCYVDSTAYAQSLKRSTVAGSEGGKRGTEPFRKKVIGRKMNPEYLKRLYPEAMSKLRQYDAFGLVAKDLDQLTAYCIARAGNQWPSSDDELTLAFCIGMSINSRIIKSQKEDTDHD